MNMEFLRKLPIPMDIKAQYPLDAKMESTKAQRDEEIKKVFTGESDKFILVIGPCSADDKTSVLDYISRLRTILTGELLLLSTAVSIASALSKPFRRRPICGMASFILSTIN
ncbi:MAG: hypothetical protein IJO61_00235, partial [Oscillospiraceae bacterium]|nr:hypothetical protein [Oscillospiraceae bacterium]